MKCALIAIAAVVVAYIAAIAAIAYIIGRATQGPTVRRHGQPRVVTS